MLRAGFARRAACLALLLCAPAASAADGETSTPLGTPSAPAPSFSTDRVIVEWADGASQADRVEARSDADVASVGMLGDPQFQLLRLEPGQDMDEALASLRSDPAVEVATRDGYSVLHSVPDDPLFGELWGLQNGGGTGVKGFLGAVAGADIDAPGAWERTVGSPSVVIADIDSGYRFDSPDLGPVAWDNLADPPGGGDNDGNGIVDDSHGADFVGTSANAPTTDGDPTDDNLIDGGHGVHTAGTMGAAGNDGVGITGVAQDVRIMPLRACGYFTDPTPMPTDESGTICPFSSQILAINYAGSHGARVANMSLGGTSANLAVRNAIAANPHVLFVISAGNDGPLAANANNDVKPHYPCNYNPLVEGKSEVDNVICVAATNQADGLASFSDWGATSVDLGAPGTETLSTYPAIEDRFSDDFETDDFATTWSSEGAGFGRAGDSDSPLTSFGMTDSPGAAPLPSSVHQVTLSTGVAIPAGYGACKLSALRYRSGGTGGSFFYQVLSDGSQVFINSTSAATGGSTLVPFSTAPITGLAGHSVKVRFGFTAGPSPTAANGIWLDDVKLTCYAPLATPVAYSFLQGTSMAAPHVTGAAGLLFSLKPSASVTEIRKALLAGVDPVPSLTGKTVTGGRLSVPKAMDAMEEETGEVIVNELPPGTVAAAEKSTPAARAIPPVLSSCKVPKLTGKALGQAKSALTAAGCKLGKVKRPKARKRSKAPSLIVKSSTPASGAKPASGKVDLTLGPKPKPKKRHH